jgi:hypothetical protein
MPPAQVFFEGPSPTDALMCDIPAPTDPSEKDCALPAEASDPNNVWLTQAATSLATTRSSLISLDFSQSAQAKCGANNPTKATYLGGGPFPDGATVCIDPAQFPNTYANETKACIAKCEDLINMSNLPFKPANVHDYCVANAKTSTNYKRSDFANACTAGGNPVMPFPEKRRAPEPVAWNDLSGGMTYDAATKNLTRAVAQSGPAIADFNEGAASVQVIKSGDAWVELETVTANQGVAVSLRNSCADPMNCVDSVPNTTDLGIALLFNETGEVYIFDAATVLFGGPYGTYTPGERYRLKVKDNNDGNATISFSRLTAPCTEGTVCAEDEFGPNVATLPYPLRLDVSIRGQNAGLSKATMVYIHQ